MAKKKVGNAVRTKSQIRGSKSKGSSFEYDCQSSLQQMRVFKDLYRTAERGYQREYDLRSDEGKCCFECKRLKGMSWNQAKKFLINLIGASEEGYGNYVLFKSNQQPCLVMYFTATGVTVQEFEDVFGVPFIKHPSTRRKKG